MPQALKGKNVTIQSSAWRHFFLHNIYCTAAFWKPLT